MPSNAKALEQAAESACAQEQIQFSGAIQPHGYLLCCDSMDYVIRHVSANCGEFFGVPAQELIGLPLTEVFETWAVAELQAPPQGNADAPPEYVLSTNIGVNASRCDVSVHRNQGLLHIEIESDATRGDRSGAEMAHRMSTLFAGAAAKGEDVHRIAAEQVRELTGFERVMVYRFLADGSGEVVSEALSDAVPSYLGLRFPASDIPPQARALYLRSRVRLIANTDYIPSPIVPPALPDGQPLDLSFHGLRSVSPVHLEYMRNMGMAASMSISIVVDGQLWGLIACHHRTPLRVTARQRTAADLFGLLYSQRLEALLHARTAAHRATVQNAYTGLLRSVSERGMGALIEHLPQLRELIACESIVYASPVIVAGDDMLVSAAALADAKAWVGAQPATNAVVAVATQELWRKNPGEDAIAGLLALRLPQDALLCFFRSEMVEQVQWAGEPVKHLVTTDDGVRLAPRRSFSQWKQTMRGQCQPWSEDNLADATVLQTLLSR